MLLLWQALFRIFRPFKGGNTETVSCSALKSNRFSCLNGNPAQFEVALYGVQCPFGLGAIKDILAVILSQLVIAHIHRLAWYAVLSDCLN